MVWAAFYRNNYVSDYNHVSTFGGFTLMWRNVFYNNAAPSGLCRAKISAMPDDLATFYPNKFTPYEMMLYFGRLSGKFGNFVFYHRKGINYFRAAPRQYTKPPTLAQLAKRSRFLQAVDFAKNAISNPITKAALAHRAQGERSAYHQAIKEFLSSG